MRIAVIATLTYPCTPPFAGGLEAHVWHAVSELRRRGHDVWCFAAHGTDIASVTPAAPVAHWRPSEHAARDVSMVDMGRMVEHHAYTRVMHELREGFYSDFDVVHVHALHPVAALEAERLPWPVVWTLHTPPTPWLESAFTITGASGVRCVAVSDYIADAWQVLPERPVTIHNGIEPAAWPLGAGGTGFVWTGRMVAEKATHLACEAALEAGVTLRLAGPMSDPDYFDAEVVPLLGESVQYVGHLDQREAAKLVGSAAGVFVTPQWDEPFCLAAAEAQMCGTPVLALGRGGVPEVVEDGVTGVLARTTSELAAATSLAAAFDRRRVAARARERFSLAAMAERYERVYASPRAVSSTDSPSMVTRP